MLNVKNYQILFKHIVRLQSFFFMWSQIANSVFKKILLRRKSKIFTNLTTNNETMNKSSSRPTSSTMMSTTATPLNLTKAFFFLNNIMNQWMVFRYQKYILSTACINNSLNVKLVYTKATCFSLVAKFTSFWCLLDENKTSLGIIYGHE